MSNEAQLTLTGDRELSQLLRELGPRIAKKGLKKAMVAAAKPIRATARANARQLTGTLRRAIKSKVKSYSSGNVIAMVGADKNTVGERVSPSGRSSRVVPAKYIHLVEGGHGGPHPAAAHPFLRPAYESNLSQSLQLAQDRLKEAVEEESQKGK